MGFGKAKPTLYITLSETRQELHVVARRHGWSLDGITMFELVEPDASMDNGRELTVLHPAELELSETTKLIFETADRIQPVAGGLRQPVGNAPAGAKSVALPPADPGA